MVRQYGHPENSQKLEGAHQFINFMLDPENAAQNADYVGYSTPNNAALDILGKKFQGMNGSTHRRK